MCIIVPELLFFFLSLASRDLRPTFASCLAYRGGLWSENGAFSGAVTAILLRSLFYHAATHICFSAALNVSKVCGAGGVLRGDLVWRFAALRVRFDAIFAFFLLALLLQPPTLLDHAANANGKKKKHKTLEEH